MSNKILQLFPFKATLEQQNSLIELSEFTNPTNPLDFFVLRGAAGTGKTSLVKAVVDYLEGEKVKYFLAAPTGRAAKVISTKTQKHARTVHSLIYTPETSDGINIVLHRKTNQEKAFSVFIIDESSMIDANNTPSGRFQSANSLLHDLMFYVKEGNPNNKVIFIGDNYQLPPINADFSPALDIDYLHNNFRQKGKMAELKEVKRQANGSYILENATKIRQEIDNGTMLPISYQHVSYQKSTILLSQLMQTFDFDNPNHAIMIAYKNTDVNWWNNSVRQRRWGQAQADTFSLFAGEQVLINNNWGNGTGGFVSKGETGKIISVNWQSKEIVADLTFVDAVVAFPNYQGEMKEYETKILLDVLRSEKAEIDMNKQINLFARANKQNKTYRESKRICDDKYLGAMQLRYGYAMTCHKAQGGEWEHVFLHPWYRQGELRWLYTAVTRAKKELYSYVG